MTNNEINPRDEFRKSNLDDWRSFLLNYFQNNIPESEEWNNPSEIISVLNAIGEESNLTHLFLPEGGGLDLTGASSSYEEDCIELHFGNVSYIVKPDCLMFESFNDEYEWAYFRLETLDLNPSGVYDSYSSMSEELIELSPGNYESRVVWDQGFYGYDENGNEKTLPDSARLVIRCFSGSFAIFAKGSLYNKSHESYDALHNDKSPSEFRQYIEQVIDYLK